MKKIAVALVCVLLGLSVLIGGAAVVYQTAFNKTGSVVSKTVNRVNFTLTDTEQTFSPADGQYVAELQFTASKTEPDFYAVMNNISLSGMGFEKLEVIPTEDTAVPFSGAVLPAQDGECEEMTWLLRITFSAQSGTTLTPTLTIDYTSGVKAEAANRRLFEAPLTFIIEE